jgi:hypothetical protein
MAKCQICGKTPLETALYRVNETGVTGIFRCRNHLPQGQKIDPEIKKIVTVITTNRPFPED